jgi:predicted nuclease of predicted toxin-antitoxin system
LSLLFDQNLSRKLPSMLSAGFPGSEHVLLAGLTRADDREVWNYAAARQLAIVSKDSDFAQLSAALGQPPKVVWLRVGNAPTRAVAALLQARMPDIQAFLSNPTKALLTLP